MSSDSPRPARRFPRQRLYNRVNLSFSVMSLSVFSTMLLCILALCITLILSLSRRDFEEACRELTAEVLDYPGLGPEATEAELEEMLKSRLDPVLEKYWAVGVSLRSREGYASTRPSMPLILEESDLESREPASYSSKVKSVTLRCRGRRYYYYACEIRFPAGSVVLEAMEDVQDKYIYVVILSVIIGVSIALAVIVVLALGRYAARRALAPLAAIAQSVRNVSQENISLGMQGQGRPESEVDSLLIELNGMLARLERSFDDQRRFVADVSHELRIPLTIIQGYIDIIQGWGSQDEHIASESLEAIATEIRAMNRLVENLLFLANLDSGNIILNPEEIDLEAMLAKLAAEGRLMTGVHSVSFTVRKGLRLVTDRSLLEQSLRAVLDNAVKYTEPGGEITLGAQKTRSGAEVWVKDTGAGMDQKDVERVNQRFYRADPARARKSGGSGLGLSIVDSSLAAIGGTLHITSKPGEGSTVRFALPNLQI